MPFAPYPDSFESDYPMGQPAATERHWRDISNDFTGGELEDPAPEANSSKNWWGKGWGWLVAILVGGLLFGGFIVGAFAWTGGEVLWSLGTFACMIVGVAWICWLIGRWFRRKKNNGFLPRYFSMGYLAIPFAVWGWISLVIWIGNMF